jgi:hypothetical protein
MGNSTSYGLPSAVLSGPPKEYRIPHKGIDCVSLQVNGKHHSYACYHHANLVESLIQDGDERVEVTRWGVDNRRHLHRDYSGGKDIVCCIV